MKNGDDIEYPAILKQMDKGIDVDVIDAINAMRWRCNNQRREIAKLHGANKHCHEAMEKMAGRIVDLEGLLRELIDIEGPQPGHVMWFRKVQEALGMAQALPGCLHPRFDENGVCTCCKEFYDAKHDSTLVERECGACGRIIPKGGSLHCGLDHAPIVRCDECGNEIDPATCHCGACIVGHPPDHAFVPIGCECWRSTVQKEDEHG